MAQNEAESKGFTALCEDVRNHLPPELGEEAWYLVIATVLLSCPKPDLLSSFYSHIINSTIPPSTHVPDQFSEDLEKWKNHFSLRLRDVLLKCVAICGAPQVLCALIPLAKAEGDPAEKAERSVRSEKWNNINVPTIHTRGVQTIDTIYGASLLPKVFSSFGAHSQDIQFMELFTVYGMYLSDHTVLSALETELVVYTGITIQGLRSPGLWHIRGLGRLLGARGTDESTEQMNKIKDMLRGIKQAVVRCVEFVDLGSEEGGGGLGGEYERRCKVGEWANVGDVSRELGGWGDD